MIAPSPVDDRGPSAPTTDNENVLIRAVDTTVYDVVPRGKLPVIDPSFTIKRLVVLPRHLTRVNKFLIRYGHVLGFVYVGGVVLRTISIFAAARIGRFTAPVSLLVQIPAMMTVVLHFRVQFVRLLMKTYDFWYYLAMNLVWVSCFAWYFRDLRIAILPIMWIDVQNATLLDSFFHDFRAIVVASWTWCIFLFAVVGAVSLDAIDAVDSETVLLATRLRTITVKEVLLNAVGTTVILVLRIIYRKRETTKSQANSTERMAQCITYRWPLVLHPRSEANDPMAFTAQQWHGQRHIFNPSRLQLVVPVRNEPFASSDIVMPLAVRLYRLRVRGPIQWVTRVVGLGGFAMTAIVLFIHSKAALPLALLGLLCTSFYSCMLLCFYQRKLFLRLVWSFDFAFISLQISSACVAVADLFRWRTESSMVVASFWLWMHLAMTLDALTPVMRRRLGFQAWFQIPIFLLFKLATVLLLLEIFLWDSQQLQDRLVVSVQVGGRPLHLHVVPFLISRLLTVCMWCMRMLYRIVTRTSDHDLLLVQSHVQFDAIFQRKRPKRKRVSHSLFRKSRVVPTKRTSPRSKDSADSGPLQQRRPSMGLSQAPRDRFGLHLPTNSLDSVN